MKILLAILLISGCATNQPTFFDKVRSVNVGDDYNEMIAKIGKEPYSIKCYESGNYKSCTAVYEYGGYMPAYKFNDRNIIVSIYR
jgi:hypothetical protein